MTESVAAFAGRIRPLAAAFDRDERIPQGVLDDLVATGALGALVPSAYGGAGLEMAAFADLNETLGAVCSSVRTLVTVHNMVVAAVGRWGTHDQQREWLPQLATGACIAAVALSEPNVGSDAAAIETVAKEAGDGGYLVTGRKSWTSFGQLADVFLVLAKTAGGAPLALLVRADTPGLTVTAVRGLLGLRGSMVAELALDRCQVAPQDVVGRPGFGLSPVFLSALVVGRLSVACGAVGVAQACLNATLEHASTRIQFRRRIREHQLVQRLVTDMATRTRAARLLCQDAAVALGERRPGADTAVWMAKYAAAAAAMQAAGDALLLHGASACVADHPVQRMFRDAKLLEIIEGTPQINQVVIADELYRNFDRSTTTT